MAETENTKQVTLHKSKEIRPPFGASFGPGGFGTTRPRTMTWLLLDRSTSESSPSRAPARKRSRSRCPGPDRLSPVRCLASRTQSQEGKVVRLDFAQWFKHARNGHRCVIFRDPRYNPRTGGFQTMDKNSSLTDQVEVAFISKYIGNPG